MVISIWHRLKSSLGAGKKLIISTFLSIHHSHTYYVSSSLFLNKKDKCEYSGISKRTFYFQQLLLFCEVVIHSNFMVYKEKQL